MAKAIQQIRQELAAIEERVASLAVEVHRIYTNYLNKLSHSARKQLILASYQICTQAYPESFLKLSASDRAKLQENLKKLGKTMHSKLLDLQTISVVEDAKTNILSSSDESSALVEPSPEQTKTITNPDDLVLWCQQVEKGINQLLESVSHEANFLLQEAFILPDRVPAKVLEIAMQSAEGAAISQGNSPNLLNLLVETEREIDEEMPDVKSNAQLTKLTAIHLRLIEIEFSDPSLSIERNQLRTFLEKLSKIRQQYRQLQREYAIAQADAAWRATWYED
jgi:thiaminase